MMSSWIDEMLIGRGGYSIEHSCNTKIESVGLDE